ncbi:hypothetical protein TNCV_4915511 [Trichonephila clavipes]|nr:hypothetical protein TNCV_4915511 [Trichonephila clavipes]
MSNQNEVSCETFKKQAIKTFLDEQIWVDGVSKKALGGTDDDTVSKNGNTDPNSEVNCDNGGDESFSKHDIDVRSGRSSLLVLIIDRVSRVQILVTLKTHREEKLLHFKSVVSQSSPVGVGESWKSGCQLMCCPRHFTEAQNYEGCLQ